MDGTLRESPAWWTALSFSLRGITHSLTITLNTTLTCCNIAGFGTRHELKGTRKRGERQLVGHNMLKGKGARISALELQKDTDDGPDGPQLWSTPWRQRSSSSRRWFCWRILNTPQSAHTSRPCSTEAGTPIDTPPHELWRRALPPHKYLTLRCTHHTHSPEKGF